MKRILILIATATFISCNQPGKQYFESGPEIDIVKKGVKAYLDHDWATYRSIYADSAKFAANTWDPQKFIGLEKHLEEEKASVENFSDIRIGDDVVYQMIINNKGEKWVYMWFTWSANVKNGTRISTGVHEGLKFDGGKVVFHFAEFNELPFYLALQPADTTKNP